jgi:hypothetical protein
VLRFIGDDVCVEQLVVSMLIGLFVLDSGISGAVMFDGGWCTLGFQE